MTKFKPTDKVKYDGEVLTILVSRKNFANKKILYRFEGKGNLEVEEKDLKRVALTPKQKKAEKTKQAQEKLLKLGQVRKDELMPHKDALKEIDPKIDLEDMADEHLISLGKFSKEGFADMIEQLLIAESNLNLNEEDDEELTANEEELIAERQMEEDEDEDDKPKMSRKSKKGKK